MKSITNYIDECKVLTGSDYATAKAIGVERSVISSIRRREAIADENAVKVAELLGIDPGEVLLAAAMARSSGTVRQAWESVSKRAGIVASMLILAVLASGFSNRNEANTNTQNIHYAKSYLYFVFPVLLVKSL